MLLANTIVAEYLVKEAKDKALLRVHDDIEETKKLSLYEEFNAVGVPGMDLRNSKTL